tara:strand:+ start:1012 stop:1428 length:417 start_codon:yes stop_codon:yes gene_type:complete
MENQVEQIMKKAFWDIIDEKDSVHLKKLLNEIKDILCSFVPNRKDIHIDIYKDFESDINWHFQEKLLDWIELFQSPVHDKITRYWRENIKISKLSEFLKFYYEHLETVKEDIIKYKETWTGNNTAGSAFAGIKMKTGF